MPCPSNKKKIKKTKSHSFIWRDHTEIAEENKRQDVEANKSERKKRKERER